MQGMPLQKTWEKGEIVTEEERLHDWHISRIETAIVQIYGWLTIRGISADDAIREIDGPILDKVYLACRKNLR